MIDEGQLDEALRLYNKALKIKRRACGADHEQVADMLFNIGAVLTVQGWHSEALEMLEEALRVYTRALGVDSRQIARVHYSISLSRQGLGDMAGALKGAKEVLRVNTMHGVNDAVSLQAAKMIENLGVGR